MATIEPLQAHLLARFAEKIERSHIACGELTLEIPAQHLKEIALVLRDDPEFDFKLLIDVCGVDYLHYGLSQWETESATYTGFSRGVEIDPKPSHHKHRFASVYHLLSLTLNHRVRLRVFIDEHNLQIPSVTDIWPAANWFEREAFDLFGIIYVGHPDLRRILTDYGFVGHPFRKDFPLIGNVEARYDAKTRSVIYEPVSIQPRILEPKVIRKDHRYEEGSST
jgi:NADH-quinone oxidoreductase subunit C